MSQDVKTVYETLSLIQNVHVECNKPVNHGLFHYIDVSWNSKYIEIQWSQKEGFLLYASSDVIPGRGDYSIDNEYRCSTVDEVINLVIEAINS